jgi:Na+-transporting methylmalonyl-CoA/oxaloacetate decarboxylase gamma subunit
MADSVETSVVKVSEDFINNVHDRLHKLIYAHIGVVILLLALLVGVGYGAMKMHERDLAHAEQLQQAFNQANTVAAQAQKQLADIIAADAVQRAQESAKQDQIELTMAQRAQTPPPAPVATALKPSADAAAVISGLQFVYSDSKPPINPIVEPDGKIALALPDAQRLVSTKADLVTSQANLQDEIALFTLEQSKSTSLSKDLGQCQDTVSKDEAALKAADPAIKAYAKLARQSKFRRILGSVGRNTERIAVFAAGVYFGKKL